MKKIVLILAAFFTVACATSTPPAPLPKKERVRITQFSQLVAMMGVMSINPTQLEAFGIISCPVETDEEKAERIKCCAESQKKNLKPAGDDLLKKGDIVLTGAWMALTDKTIPSPPDWCKDMPGGAICVVDVYGDTAAVGVLWDGRPMINLFGKDLDDSSIQTRHFVYNFLSTAKGPEIVGYFYCK